MTELEQVDAVPHREGQWGWVPFRPLLKRGIIRPARMSKGLITGPATLLYATGLRSTDGLTLPEFLGIGAVKAGTTWLHHNLSAHPDLYLPAEKEIHFFNSRVHRGVRTYAGNFAAAGDRIPGEITPSYSVLPSWKIRLAARLVGDARLIMIIRDPIQRAWSHAVMKLAREKGRHPGTITDREARAHFESPDSMGRGLYTESISRWLEHFSTEQLLVVFYDDIEARPRQLLEEVFAHIGAGIDLDWAALPYNSRIDRGVRGGPDVVGSSTPPLSAAHRTALFELYGTELERLASRYGGAATEWLERAKA